MCRSAKTDAPIKHHLPTWQPVGLSDQPSQIITLKKMIYRFLKSGLVAQGAGRL